MKPGARGTRGLVAALAAVIAVTGCAPGPVRTPPPGSATLPSGSSATSTPEPTPDPTPTPVPSAIPAPGHELYGFVPYWEIDTGIAAHLRQTPLSRLALFSVTTTADGAIDTGQLGYKRIVGATGRQVAAEARKRGTRVDLVFSSFGDEANAALFSDSARMEASITSLVRLVADLHLDGVNVDVEGFDPSLVPAYGAFIRHLREALVAADAAAQLSVSTTAGPVGAAMAGAAVQAAVDRVFLMGYDYHFSGSSPGASAPLLRSDGGERSLTWSLDLYVATGVPPERTMLGLPLYGMSWPVAGPVVGAPETGPGATWLPKGHVAMLQDPKAVPVLDPVEQVAVYFLGSDGSVGQPPGATDGVIVGESPSAGAPFGSPGTPGPSGPTPTPGVSWTAVYVDTPGTLASKLALANARGLVGAGFWAIGYERGLPGYTDLMRRFVAGDALP